MIAYLLPGSASLVILWRYRRSVFYAVGADEEALLFDEQEQEEQEEEEREEREEREEHERGKFAATASKPSSSVPSSLFLLVAVILAFGTLAMVAGTGLTVWHMMGRK